MAALASDIIEQFTLAEYPHLAEFTMQHVMQPGYDFMQEFDFGLDLILDGLVRAAQR